MLLLLIKSGALASSITFFRFDVFTSFTVLIRSFELFHAEEIQLLCVVFKSRSRELIIDMEFGGGVCVCLFPPPLLSSFVCSAVFCPRRLLIAPPASNSINNFFSPSISLSLICEAIFSVSLGLLCCNLKYTLSQAKQKRNQNTINHVVIQ